MSGNLMFAALVLGSATFVSIGPATPAAAQDINLNGVVRSISLFGAIRSFCPQADVPTVRKYESAMIEVASKMADRHSLEVLMRAELPRRKKEVQITGAAQWCEYQRDRPTGKALFRQ